MVFDKFWFRKHQRILLKILNTSIGRYIFNIKNKYVVNVTPNSYTYIKRIHPVQRKAEVGTIFYNANYMAIRLANNLKWFWKALHVIDYLVLDRQSLVPDFGFSTLNDYYCAAGTGAGFDQALRLDDYGVTWSALKAHTSATTVYPADRTSSHAVGFAGTAGGASAVLCRSVWTFDTTSGPIGPISGTFTPYRVGGANWDGYYWSDADWGYTVVNVDCADPTDQLVAADWNTFDMSAKASDSPVYTVAVDGLANVSGYYYHTLNAHGLLGGYNPGGYSQFGVVMIADQENFGPYENYTASLAAVYFTPVDYSSGAYVSELEITTMSALDIKINIGDSWKTVAGISINVGDDWKVLSDLNINVGDAWKDLA